ncbi:MAG: carbon storage regulator CsrA [Alphaproteobacteria bacterium]
MLYLTRKIGESVVINGDIEVTVIEVRGRSVRLGFTFPPTASVLRREIFERVQEENRAAADGASFLDDLTGAAAPTSKLAQTAQQKPAKAPAETSGD